MQTTTQTILSKTIQLDEHLPGMEYDKIDRLLEYLLGECKEDLDPEYDSPQELAELEKRIVANAHKSRPAPHYRRNTLKTCGGGGCEGGCGH